MEAPNLDAPRLDLPSVPAKPAESEVGTMLGGRYVLERKLAMGGMGEVWQGRHVTLGKRVAVKLLRPHLLQREGASERFYREARILAKLATRRAVAVFDFGITDELVPFLVMELVDGETLSERIARERHLSPRAAVRILSQAGRALERAHALGIAHLDFKPDNVLLGLDEDGQLDVKVADFGVAQLVGESQDGASAGTFAYMAPEQLDHAPIGTSADVWAFGVVAYECLTGHHPFDDTTRSRVALRIRTSRAAPAAEHAPSVPPAFDAWFARACAVDPAARFPSVRIASLSLGEALGVVTDPDDTRPHALPATSKRKLAPWALGLGGVALLGAGVLAGVAVRAPSAAVSPAIVLSITQVAPPATEPAGDAPARVVEPARPSAPRAPAASVLPAYRDLPDAPDATTPAGWKHDPYR